MNTIPLAALATTALIGLGVTAPATAVTATTGQTASAAAAGSTTTHERGIVIECQGRIAGRPAHTSLYENSEFGNVIAVHIGRDGDEVGNSRETDRPFLVDRQVRGAVKVGTRRATITGTAVRVGRRTAVHEERDDAGQHITVDGWHRKLRTDLVLRWGDRRAPLTCGDAFYYDLQVTREEAAG